MEKYIDLLRVIIKNFNIDNNPEFDDIIKNIENLYLDNNIDRIDKILDIKLEKIHLNNKYQ